jgi:acyl-CoA thioester hydrolase/thioesterase-3
MTTKHQYSKFESEIAVRPDDIDMNNHVHNSKYFDYVLAARYDQMSRCYKMPMEEFIAMGFGWVVKTCFIEYKRPLVLGDTLLVRTWIDEVGASTVKVRFEILKKDSKKLASDGYCEYSIVSLSSGRAEKIPQIVIEKYSI